MPLRDRLRWWGRQYRPYPLRRQFHGWCVRLVLKARTQQDLLDAAAVYLARALKPEELRWLRRRITAKPVASEYGPEWSQWDSWWARDGWHFADGMRIRNLLRAGGFTEKRMGFSNWDDYYTRVTEVAVYLAFSPRDDRLAEAARQVMEQFDKNNPNQLFVGEADEKGDVQMRPLK